MDVRSRSSITIDVAQSNRISFDSSLHRQSIRLSIYFSPTLSVWIRTKSKFWSWGWWSIAHFHVRLSLVRWLDMIAICWALHIDTTLEEERICNGEVRSHRRGSRERSKCSSSEKRSRLAETNLGRIYKGNVWQNIQNRTEWYSLGRCENSGACTHSWFVALLWLVYFKLQTQHCCFHWFWESGLVCLV